MTDSVLEQGRALLQQAQRVAAFSGAGLSAESGLSTFRDPDPDSLWSRFDPMELASVDGFMTNPERVIEWYSWRRQMHADTQPNEGHRALAKQEHLIQITQNVDNLLEQAGVRPELVYHLHGTITKDRCHNDRCDYEEDIDLHAPLPLRNCPQCGHRMRPAVVWFGESLPEQTWLIAQQLCTQIDCLLVIGTSASVYPAAGLIHLAKQHGSRILVVNTRHSDASGMADMELVGTSGAILPALLDGLQLRSH